MTTPTNPHLTPGGARPRWSPRQLVDAASSYVWSTLRMLALVLVASAGVAAFYVGLRAIWWGAQLVLKALGV